MSFTVAIVDIVVGSSIVSAVIDERSELQQSTTETCFLWSCHTCKLPANIVGTTAVIDGPVLQAAKMLLWLC